MSMRPRICMFLFVSVVLICCQAVLAAGAGTDGDEKDMKDRIEFLEQRLAQIEKMLTPQHISRKDLADELEERVAKLESRYGPTSFDVYWDKGLRLDTMDKSIRLKIGGQVMNDWSWYADKDDSVAELEDGTEFRRARIYMSGQIYDDWEFKVEYDFIDGDADFKDVWIGAKNVPYIGHIKVGHLKEPFGLEELISSKYTTFMECSLANVFAPDYNTGVMIHNDMFGQRATWAVGVFRDTDDYGDDDGHDGDYSYTGRLTYLPWYADEGRKLLHLGVAYSHRSPQDRILRYRQRPEAHLAPRFVDTGNFEAKRADLIGLEAALVYGPFSLQSEYMQAIVDTINATDVCFQGFYVYGSYFITGEHRPYKKSDGTFDRVKPKKDFRFKGEDRGPGAWEVAARYSYLDLDDKRIDGGRLQDLTFGVNWYLNPNMRVMWNYVHADLADAGDADIFQMRFQIDF